MTQLSAQQLAGIEKIKSWHEGAAYGGWTAPFRLFGYAGTGKTTLAKEIPAALGLRDVRYGTFTGKAAHVLRSKGAAPVSTIHSGIYKPMADPEAVAALQEAETELADLEETRDQAMTLADPQRTAYVIEQGWADPLELAGAIAEVSERLPGLRAAARRVSFEWNPDSEWAHAELIILDEVSMVDAKLAADVERYGVPIIVLGDPAQLPPVEGGGYYTNAQPDHMLTEIHRFALDNPITALATRIRESTDGTLGLTMNDVTPRSVRHAMEHDQVLVWRNKTRWSMVTTMRQLRGRPAGRVVAGDRIMVLTNNKDLAVFNGQQLDVLDSRDDGQGYTLRLKTEEGAEMTMPVYVDGFQGQEMQEAAKNGGLGQRKGRALATYADAITVHKAQGSEWPSVYVVNETLPMVGMDSRRVGREAALEKARQWLYTAATRASQNVTITAPRR
jgi:exodeoxyribonuclease-5